MCGVSNLAILKVAIRRHRTLFGQLNQTIPVDDFAHEMDLREEILTGKAPLRSAMPGMLAPWLSRSLHQILLMSLSSESLRKRQCLRKFYDKTAD